jgi:diguanylate cyclase (GGDEF)-like protein
MMSQDDGQHRLGSKGTTPPFCRLATLPRATTRAVEQLIDTLLAAMRTDSGALWLEYEGVVYTLAVRKLPAQSLHLLQQAAKSCSAPHPIAVRFSEQTYVVACADSPFLTVYSAVPAEAVRPLHRQLMPRFSRLAHTLLQANSSPIGTPAEDASHQAYRVVAETTLRRLCDLLQAAGCTLLWLSSWSNAWHRFTVGSIPDWLYQRLWEIPAPNGGMDFWLQDLVDLLRQRGQSCAALEMTVRDMVKGCLVLWRKQAQGDFTDAEVEWLHITAQVIAASLDVLETQAGLLQRVYRDPLTGVFNRLYFDMVYSQTLHAAQRHPRPISLLLLDIDNFKQLNDTLGHETGDTLLQVVGQILQQVRAGDVPARYGGDEFVVLLPDTDRAGACSLKERLQHLLQQATEQLGLSVPVTFSIGCATVTNGDSRLLLLADQDMYTQKQRKKTATG